MSAAWVHGFDNSVTGALLNLLTGLPLGASTTLDMEYDAFVLGLHIVFGPQPCGGCGAAPAEACPAQ